MRHNLVLTLLMLQQLVRSILELDINPLIASSPIRFINIFTIKVNKNIYIVILKVCFSDDFIKLFSQWQCSSSHKSTIFSSSLFFLLRIKSIKKPYIIPKANFTPSIPKIVPIGAASDISIGSISSEVER